MIFGIVAVVPASPNGLSLTSRTMTSVTISWSSSQNGFINQTLVNYTDITNQAAGWMSKSVGNVLSCTIDGLTPGHSYNVCIVFQSYDKYSSANCTHVETSEYIIVSN